MIPCFSPYLHGHYSCGICMITILSPPFLLYFFWFFSLRLVLENTINESGEKGITSIYYMINHTIIVSHYLLSLIINYGLIRQTSVSIDVWWRDTMSISKLGFCMSAWSQWVTQEVKGRVLFWQSSRVFVVLKRSDY